MSDDASWADSAVRAMLQRVRRSARREHLRLAAELEEEKRAPTGLPQPAPKQRSIPQGGSGCRSCAGTWKCLVCATPPRR